MHLPSLASGSLAMYTVRSCITVVMHDCCLQFPLTTLLEKLVTVHKYTCAMCLKNVRIWEVLQNATSYNTHGLDKMLSL